MKIAVVGTDTVGLVSATCFAEIGVQVTCINSDAKLIENLNNGIIHVYEPGLEERLNRNHRDGNLKFATDIKPLIDQIDLVVCATPTPAMPDGTIDLRQVAGLARTMGQTVTKYFAIAILSTVPIGTARQLRAALNIELEKRGANIHYDIISLPEFLREGSAVRDFLKPDRIVAGVGSEKGEELVRQLYKPLLDRGTPLILTDQTSAELIKYASNAMLANRISFMNDIANLSELVGADIDMVMKGMGADPRIGADYLNSGCGYGGTSLPKDVKALIKTAEKAGYAMKVVNPGNKIRCSYVGYKMQSFDISSNQMDVTMEEAMKFTDVKVVGRTDSIDSSSWRYKDRDSSNGDDGTFNLMEQNPTFPGGQGEIMKYLSTHLRYPAVAREMQVEAEITVKFVIDKTGFVRSPQVVTTNSRTPLITAETAKAAKEGNEEALEANKNYYDAVEALKEEAIHVVRNMPRWEPGRQNGKRIETTFTLPVDFKLN